MWFRVPKITFIRLLMADYTVKKLMEVHYNVLESSDYSIFPSYFIILDSKVDFEVFVILGRLFLSIRRALVDIETSYLKFLLNHEYVVFWFCQFINQPKDMSVISIIDTVDEESFVSLLKE